jgi:hypothetical protein
VNIHESERRATFNAAKQAETKAKQNGHVAPVERGKGGGQIGKPHKIMTDKERREVVEEINTIYGGTCTQAELKELASAHNVGFSTMAKLYYSIQD